jgi:hypothetical protein
MTTKEKPVTNHQTGDDWIDALEINMPKTQAEFGYARYSYEQVQATSRAFARKAVAESEARRQGEAVAWARKWYVDGETPAKERNSNGRMAWPTKFKLLPVTVGKCLADDVHLIIQPATAPTRQAVPFNRQISDARIKKAMEYLGMHNSQSLYSTLKQLENEIRHELTIAVLTPKEPQE